MEKTRPKNITITPPSTLSELCMKIQGCHDPPDPAADAHAYCNECVLSVDCRLRFNLKYF